MFSKRYGYTQIATLKTIRRKISSSEYHILQLAAEKSAKQLFGSHPKGGEFFSITTSSDETVVEVSWYPATAHIDMQAAAQKLFAKHMKVLSAYL